MPRLAQSYRLRSWVNKYLLQIVVPCLSICACELQVFERTYGTGFIPSLRQRFFFKYNYNNVYIILIYTY